MKCFEKSENNNNMESGEQKTDSQKLQQQSNGPRVSFNRDVHVKRIGKRPPNETANYPIQTKNLQPPETYHLRREPPTDLSEEDIIKEAARVLAQAESVKCTVEGNKEIKPPPRTKRHNQQYQQQKQQQQEQKQQQKRIIPNQFHSLPLRGKKHSKPITRSVSDASSKKQKRPSIFNLFSRRSDPNLNQSTTEQQSKEGIGAKNLIRSKSDVGSSKYRRIHPQKRHKSESEDNVNATIITTTLKPAQLSPIIENQQREDYFEKGDSKEKSPQPPIQTASQQATTSSVTAATTEDSMFKKKAKNETKLKETTPSKTNSKQDKNSNTYTSYDDIDFVPPTKSVGDGLKDTLTSLAAPHTQSTEGMHSSQLPPQKPPLTKGVTVDGMVKRLSMERFSPPPVLSGPAFSYTRPSDQVVYSQVLCDSDNKPKQRSSVSPREMDSSYKYQTSTTNHTNGYDHHRSAIDKQHDYPSHSNKSEVYVNGNFDSPYRSYSPPEITKVRGVSSPLHWKHSPRNLSDEDEGLGFEPRKYFEEDLPTPSQMMKTHYHTIEYERNQKAHSNEPPIVPVIRSVSPVDIRMDVSNRGRADGMDSRRRDIFNEFNDLSYRREQLESKIKSRRFGYPEDKTARINYRYSPERSREFKDEFDDTLKHLKSDFHDKFLSPEPAETTTKFHKLNSSEVLNKYSPERTHLDMVSPSRDVKTSKYVKTKYIEDESGGVKETYKKETHYDEYGQPHVTESRHRERFDSPRRSKEPEIPYKNRLSEEKYRQEYEPKSLDSQYSEMTRSSPENMKRIETMYRRHHEENWHDTSTLTRDKRQQRSFDKGDSGIENDFRKESFSGELTSKWRKRTVYDEIKSCETFLRKERRHSEDTNPKQKRKMDYVYRERSIDDGSHFDPRLDKYPKEIQIKRKDNITSEYSSLKKGSDVRMPSSGPSTTITTTTTTTVQPITGTMKREKKLGGFEKVKKLFSGGKKKGSKENLLKSTTPEHQQQQQPQQHQQQQNLGKERYMVKEEEMRSRYHEYKGVIPDLKDSNVNDISTRRRLSTPRASPLLKRTSSDKSPKRSPLAQTNNTGAKAEKLGWFKSLDRRSKKKTSEKLGSSFRTPVTTTEDEFSTLRSKKSYRTPLGTQPPPQPEKNLRFFGDTDLESIPSVSKSATKPRARSSVTTLNKQNQKYSQSAYHLDKISKPVHSYKTTPRSNSMQNLDDGIDELDRPRRRHHSRSRNLDDISESGSDTEVQKENIRYSSTPKKPPREFKENGLNGGIGGGGGENSVSKYYYDRQTTTMIRKSTDRDSKSPGRNLDLPDSTATRIEFTRKPPPGPPKPARSMDRRQSYSRERERLHDSSGTEGDSSLPSQRSVVYLHATTVGAIPQPYHLNARRRAMSREELRSKNKIQQQPMTRTVSRSVSMLAPWKPKHPNEGYEINYSQEIPDNTRNNKISTIPRKQNATSKRIIAQQQQQQQQHQTTQDTSQRSSRQKYKSSSKDDLSSLRNSSITSGASKSGLSIGNNHQRNGFDKGSNADLRKDYTMNRRRIK